MSNVGCTNCHRSCSIESKERFGTGSEWMSLENCRDTTNTPHRYSGACVTEERSPYAQTARAALPKHRGSTLRGGQSLLPRACVRRRGHFAQRNKERVLAENCLVAIEN
jgi:hypothetical protein